MSAELERRRRGREPPFHETRLRSAIVSITRARRALRVVCDRLSEQVVGGEGPSLFSVHDGADADGVVGALRVRTWPELRAWTKTDNRLFQARSGEPGVWLGLFPPCWSFYLRFEVDHEVAGPGRPLEARFELSAAASLVAEVRRALLAIGFDELVVEPASAGGGADGRGCVEDAP